MRTQVNIDEYTLSLLQKIIDRKLASTYIDAVKVAAASLLGERVKSREELKLEKDMAFVRSLGDMPRTSIEEFNDKGEVVNRRYLNKDGQVTEK